MVVCHFTDFRTDSKGDTLLIDGVMQDDIKSALLEPLYYTFKQKSYRFKGSKFAVLDDVNNQVRSISGESVMHYILWSLMMAALLFELVVFSPTLLNKSLPGSKPTKEDVVKQLKQVKNQIQGTATEDADNQESNSESQEKNQNDI